MHQGAVILKLARTYPTITLTVVEAIQNALDADARNVFVGVDMRGRQVIVLDDGSGVTQEKFQQALMSVGMGVKRDDAIGRFGLGLISPLNKCKYFRFASHPAGATFANVWRFEAAVIGEQHQRITIPRTESKFLPPIPGQFMEHAMRGYPSWHSFLEINEVVEDRLIGVTDLDELESEVRVKLGSVMRAKGTSVHVVLFDAKGKVTERDIDPLEFTGEPLPVGDFVDSSCGRVVIELYRAPRDGGKRKGLVTVMQLGDNTQIPWSQFYEQARRLKAFNMAELKAAFDILKSGYFEGVISAEKIELDPSRDKFAVGQALQSLYIALYIWYSEHGQKFYEDEAEARRDARWEELGEQSLARVLDRLKVDSAFAGLARNLIGVLPDTGRIASTEERRKREKPEGDDPEPKRRRAVAKPPAEKQVPRDPRKPRLNFTLRYAYEVLRGSKRLWEFDDETGVMTFNVRHPIWESLDQGANGRRTKRNDQQIMHLQEWLTLKLLLILVRNSEPDFDFQLARQPVDEEVKLYAAMFIANT